MRHLSIILLLFATYTSVQAEGVRNFAFFKSRYGEPIDTWHKDGANWRAYRIDDDYLLSINSREGVLQGWSYGKTGPKREAFLPLSGDEINRFLADSADGYSWSVFDPVGETIDKAQATDTIAYKVLLQMAKESDRLEWKRSDGEYSATYWKDGHTLVIARLFETNVVERSHSESQGIEGNVVKRTLTTSDLLQLFEGTGEEAAPAATETKSSTGFGLDPYTPTKVEWLALELQAFFAGTTARAPLEQGIYIPAYAEFPDTIILKFNYDEKLTTPDYLKMVV